MTTEQTADADEQAHRSGVVGDLRHEIAGLRYTLRHVRNDNLAMVENLAATQRRCTELLMENRALKAQKEPTT